MRFFLITYSINGNDFEGFGNLFIESKDFKFPNNDELRKVAAKRATKNLGINVTAKNVVVINIYEFKNNKDYIDFSR